MAPPTGSSSEHERWPPRSISRCFLPWTSKRQRSMWRKVDGGNSFSCYSCSAATDWTILGAWRGSCVVLSCLVHFGLWWQISWSLHNLFDLCFMMFSCVQRKNKIRRSNSLERDFKAVIQQMIAMSCPQKGSKRDVFCINVAYGWWY